MKKHNAKILFTGNTTEQGAWLEYRKIGASAIHNLIEADRYKKGLIEKPEYSSPWILYQELKGLYQPTFTDFMQDKLDFGHFAEDFIRMKFKNVAERQGITGVKEVTAGDEVLGSTEHDFMTCTPDGWVLMENGEYIPLECKTGDSFQWQDWSGDTVPDKYYSQCQWILECTGKNQMFILGWINNRFTKVFTVERDEQFINIMLDIAQEFWTKFNQDIEPEMVGNKVEADALGELYVIPQKEPEKVENTELEPEAVALLEKSLQELKDIEKEIKKPTESIKIKIKKEMLSKGLKIMNVGGLTAKLDSRGYLKLA